MSGPVKVLSREQTRRLVIECPNRCEGMGCQHDGSGEEWRESKTLSPDTSIDYALVLMERYAKEHHKSGPYRLVEYVTNSVSTMEVIEP